jgi:hypothetical protein
MERLIQVTTVLLMLFVFIFMGVTFASSACGPAQSGPFCSTCPLGQGQQTCYLNFSYDSNCNVTSTRSCSSCGQYCAI